MSLHVHPPAKFRFVIGTLCFALGLWGLCPGAPAADHFTQRFASGQLETSFDLEYTTLTLTPNGSAEFYAASNSPAAAFPESTTGHTLAWTPTSGTRDDGYWTVNRPATLYGVNYTNLHINSNGHITFGSGVTATSGSLTPGSSQSFHFRQPRVAPYWRDLDPGSSGTIHHGRVTTPGAERTIVTFANVPRYGSTSEKVSFQIVFFDSGVITITWLGCKGSNPIVGLSGLSQTTLPSGFAESNLSDYTGASASAEHPRLFFNTNELQLIRARLNHEPFASMLNSLLTYRDLGDFYQPHNPADPKSLALRAFASAALYALTENETYAQDAKADWQNAFTLIGSAWASTSTKGLDSYWYAAKLAFAYDLCARSTAWDTNFNNQVSLKLRDIGRMIIENGGTEQNTTPGSNWQGARFASGGLALLATDHTWPAPLMDTALTRVLMFLEGNQGTGNSSGWNPEGVGYTAYPLGNFVGPFALAIDRLRPADSFSAHHGMQWMPWTLFAGATTALDIYGLGGVKTDWSDDNGHIGGEGTFGLAFAFAPDAIKPGLRHAYDRLQGDLSPLGARWDAVRHGTFWSILFYPENIAPQNPLEIWDWHRAGDDSGGLGLFTFRNAYENADDILVQFKGRLRTMGGGHDGEDGLGFRIIGMGAPWAIGGGRDQPGRRENQATVYPTDPNGFISTSSGQGTLVGPPLIKPDGGGHVIARMNLNNVGTTNHQRWFVTDFEQPATGAVAVIVVADTADNGRYWQLPTFFNHTVSVSSNTFTVTAQNGATLRGTVLQPANAPVITVGTKARGSGYALLNGGTLAEVSTNNPLITSNRYLFVENTNGEFLVVMTLQKSGAHPAVSQTAGTVADAVIQVGSRTYSLQASNVLYNGTPYSAPVATVKFSAAPHGVITSGSTVQMVPYGSAASAPMVSPDPGYALEGWDRSFNPVVASMTVNALYTNAPLTPAQAWRQLYFGTADNARSAADQFDADGDGLVNVLERAFGTIPTNSASSYKPTASIVNEAGSNFLGYTYRQLTGGSGTIGVDYTAAGLTYAAEQSGVVDGAWSVGGLAVHSIEPTPELPKVETVTLRMTQPLANAPQTYFRLKISQSP